MKVIKRGTLPEEKVHKVTCHKCKSELEYTQKDVYSDQRDGNYIKCPVCGAYINHGRSPDYYR